mmetsp:Transcript_33859/g.50766  ORF Transcript_33859/g.50766 Transcript_33859/m.50766 type:complete len:116 (+) Transcript_33859:52-399(+)
MKLFPALALVANLHAPANAADLVAAAADDIANATPIQVDFNNQVDKTKTMPKFLRGIAELNQEQSKVGSCANSGNCPDGDAAHKCRDKGFDDGYCADGTLYCCHKPGPRYEGLGE